jgi:YidC/Oxa1 family membrane protein insertase
MLSGTLGVAHADAPAAPGELTLRTERFRARISLENGGVTSFQLLDEQFSVGGKPHEIVTTDKLPYLPLAVNVEGLARGALDGAAWTAQASSERSVRIHTVVDGIAIERKLEAGAGPFQVWVTTTLANRGNSPRKLTLRESTHHYVSRKDELGAVSFLPARSSAHSSALCHPGEELERVDGQSLIDEAKRWSGSIRFTGVENVYFLNALVAEGDGSRTCMLRAEERGRDEDGEALGTLFAATLQQPPVTLAPGQRVTQRMLAYLGPKTQHELGVAGHALRESIDAGFFTKLADGLTWLLGYIHTGVGNWGVAIILLTFFVKLVLYPLTHKQMESMAKMKELKPEMDKLNALYADDREKKGAAIMELYRKRGVNPMAGCFPVLLQLPIWFSLYASLSSNIQLFHAPFMLWWHDLSSPDPFFVLPLALGVLMYVQQKLTPPAGVDPLQAKMMLYMMPTMITAFMLFLPAGLCLYMFTNSALSIAQQKYIESRLQSAKAA